MAAWRKVPTTRTWPHRRTLLLQSRHHPKLPRLAKRHQIFRKHEKKHGKPNWGRNESRGKRTRVKLLSTETKIDDKAKAKTSTRRENQSPAADTFQSAPYPKARNHKPTSLLRIGSVAVKASW